jgi:hypothetical protein
MKRLHQYPISKIVNPELLDKQLHDELDAVFVRVDCRNDKTHVILNTPTKKDLQTVKQIVDDHDSREFTDTQQIFQKVNDLIEDIIGKSVVDLNPNEQWAVLIAALYQMRALAPDMTIRSPQYWVERQDTDD